MLTKDNSKVPAKCPTNRNVGHTSTIIEVLQRVLGMATKMTRSTGGLQTKGVKRTSGSNAEYHLSIKQVQKLIGACESPREKFSIQLMAYTGIRRAEIADLDISDIRWNDGLILIRNGKGHKQRLVPLPLCVIDDLRSLIGAKTRGAVLESRKGGTLSYRQLNRIVAEIGHRAGVMNPHPKQSYITCHLLRHTFARLWKQNQGSMESLSYILGHSSQATTMDLYGKESIPEMQQNYNDIFNKIKY